MAGSERWYFTKEQLENTPSRRCGIDSDKELSYRQQAANLIQDMGQRLQVTQLCINTAIVYMHRFYMFHSFTRFYRNEIAACALFLAAKVEEQPRKLEHVIKVAHMCVHRDNPPLDVKSKVYQDQAHNLVTHENLMLQTLGFNIGVEHPHRFVVNCCQLVRASKDLAQTSYFMATNSLHLTTMCLQYKPTVVACVCIHLACKWSNWEIPTSSEGKDWFYYVDQNVTPELLEELTSEFLAILDKCPSRLKRKILSHNSANSSTDSSIPTVRITEDNAKKTTAASLITPKPEAKPEVVSNKSSLTPTPTPVPTNSKRSPSPSASKHKKVKSEPTPTKSPISYVAYKEKRDKEKALSSTQSGPEHLNPMKSISSNSQKPMPPLSSSTNSRENSQTTAPLSQPIQNQTPQKDKNILNKIEKPDNSQSISNSLASISSTQQLTVNRSRESQSALRQSQVNAEKMRQIEERNKIKNSDDFKWNNRNSNSMKTSSETSLFHSKTTQNMLTDTFLDNLVNRPAESNKSKWDNLFSSDGDETIDSKKDVDLRMEFSDNDSNQSSGGLNLTSFGLPSDFMNESSVLSPAAPTITAPPTTTSVPVLVCPPTTQPTMSQIVPSNPTATVKLESTRLEQSLPTINNSIATAIKDRKERYESNDKHYKEHHDRHHHHHHKNKHKEKKSKHKDKHKNKHRDRDKYGHVKDLDPSIRLSLAAPKDKNDNHSKSSDAPREAIKLKISKKHITGDKSSSDEDPKNKGLKLVIKRS